MKKIEPNKENKKTAIVSLGTRISLSAPNVRTIDFIYLREYLMNVLGREQVDFVSKKSFKEKNIDYFKDIKQTDFNDYDEIYIYNSAFNPFGGVFKEEALDTFEKLYYFKGDIIYALFDPKMPPMDFSSYLNYKDKNNDQLFNTTGKGYPDGKRHFDKEFIQDWREKVWKRMKVAYNGFDYKKYFDIWNGNITKGTRKNTSEKYTLYHILNEDIEWFSIWLFEYYAVNEDLDLKLTTYNKIDEPYDLVYFGNNRLNERNKLVNEFHKDESLKKLFIGYDPKLPNTTVMDYVKHGELFKTMGEQCIATLVVGDNLHNDNSRTPRFFEAMLLDVVAFIHEKFDSNKQYIKNEFLRDFVYVSTKEELKNKVEMIKNDKELYKKIIDLQRKEILDEFGYMKK